MGSLVFTDNLWTIGYKIRTDADIFRLVSTEIGNRNKLKVEKYNEHIQV